MTILSRQLLSAVSLVVALAVLASAGGCASSGESLESPPETAPPVVDEPSAPSPDPSEDGVAEPDGDPLVVVIEDEAAMEESSTRSLVRAARQERERRLQADPPSFVITDDNLADHATGELTIASANERSAPRGDDSSPPDPAGDEETADSDDEETYWRDRVRRARLDWSSTIEEIEHLENRVAELRRRFYEEDDPYYRDTQIKPSWDQSLDRLEEARDAAERFRLRVEEILEEGRRAGALPGWLREGLELEPESRVDRTDRMPEHEAREPSIVEPREPGDG